MKKAVKILAVLSFFLPSSAALAQTLGDTAAAMSVGGIEAAKTIVPVPAALNAAATPAPAAAAVPAAVNAANMVNAVNAIDAPPATTVPGATPGVVDGNAFTVPPPETSVGGNDDPFRQSFFFTATDLISIERAMQGRKTTNSGALGQKDGEKIPMIRRITLSGVAYKNPDQWVVWINGQKIVPGYMLKEIVDIKVEQDAVHLKWFDIGLNGVLNITLHPHETYDIVSGVLLPG